jgi:hypothetical protein
MLRSNKSPVRTYKVGDVVKINPERGHGNDLYVVTKVMQDEAELHRVLCQSKPIVMFQAHLYRDGECVRQQIQAARTR